MPIGKIDVSKIPCPGMRTVKTALTVTLLMVLYRLVLGPELWIYSVPMACVAAVICLQDSVGKTLQEGTARVIGTFIGGGSAVLVLLTGVRDHDFAVFAVVSGICLIFIIHICNLLNQHSSIPISCIVFMNVIFNTSGVEPMLLAFHSIANTLVGIAAAYGVNKFIYAPISVSEPCKPRTFRVRLKKKTDTAKAAESDIQKEN